MTKTPPQNLTWNGVLSQATGQHANVLLTTGDSIPGVINSLGDDLLVLNTADKTHFLRLTHIVALELSQAENYQSFPATEKTKSSVITLSDHSRPAERPPSLIYATLPLRVMKPTFDPHLTSILNSTPDQTLWHERVREADAKLYVSLRLAYEERRRADLDLEKLDALSHRHPASLDIQLLRGHVGFFLEKHTMAADALFRAAVLSQGKYWEDYAQSCLLDHDLEHALIAYQHFYTQQAVHNMSHWQDFLKLSVWSSDFAGLSAVLEAVQKRLWPDECEMVFTGLKNLDFVSEALANSLDFTVWQEALRQLHQAGNTCPKSFEHKRLKFKDRLAKVETENKFAEIEEDITGIIGEAQELKARGRTTSAFAKLNEAYQLAPGHPRVKTTENTLRGPTKRLNKGLDQSLLELTLTKIIHSHSLLVLDTCVCSIPEHLNRKEIILEQALREQGHKGLSTLEEKVSYHTFMQRLVDQYPSHFFAPDSVLEELKCDFANFKNRKARQSFGKSAKSLRRALVAASRNIEFTSRQEKRVRTTKATFNSLRLKSGLSEADYDILCRTFILAVDHKVALLTNDRGIHAGVAHIIKSYQNGNQNIAFLQPSNIEVYASLHKSHFEKVDLTRYRSP